MATTNTGSSIGISVRTDGETDHPDVAGSVLADSDCSCEYHPESTTTRIHCDGSDVRPSTAVVAMTAAIRERPPTELPPLRSTVDPDALDALAGAREPVAEHGDVVISFTYDGYEFTIHAD